MPPRKSTKAAEPAVFNLKDFQPVGFETPDERKIDMGNDVVLTVKLAHLTTRQVKEIPLKGSLEAAYRAAAKYVLDWDARAHNPATGDVIDIPAPGDPAAVEFVKKYIGEDAEPWELLEYILDNATGGQLLVWLVNPAAMQLSTEAGKSRSSGSETSDTPPSANGTTPA